MIDSVDLEMRNLWGSSVVMWALRSGELAVVEGAVTMEKGSSNAALPALTRRKGP